jgi:hypothetical protein
VNSRGTALSFSKSGIAAQPQISLRSRVWLLPKAVLMAILCGSYKTKFTALSKLNLVGGPCESSNFAGRAVCRPANGEIDGTEALPLRKRSISTRLRSAPDGRERKEKQGMLCLPLRLPLATELLIQ